MYSVERWTSVVDQVTKNVPRLDLMDFHITHKTFHSLQVSVYILYTPSRVISYCRICDCIVYIVYFHVVDVMSGY